VTCVNFYGSTETQRAVGYHVVESESGAPGAAPAPEVLPLGRGIADVQLLVLDRRRRLAGIGELGELCVRSPHLAAGYLGDPELTRERFLVNPSTGIASDRLYRTGDLGRYLPNGEAVFVSRADHQVKIRGFRIELGEIEATLGHHPGVREAVVVLREDRPGDRQLAAYVVPCGAGAPPGAGELRAFLKARLPEYMVPADVVTLAELPLTPNRKVDRRALPPPDRAAAPDPAAAPGRTPLEELVTGIWSEVLGRAAFGRDDDFFALGGHSLLLTRVASRLRAATGVELPLRALFEEPTVAGLAGRLEAGRRAGLASPAPPILPVPRDGSGLPLSFAQQRLWFLHRLAPESPFYNLPGGARFAGPLDLPALAASLAAAVRRHEPLRTVFAETEREPVQIVLPPSAPRLPLADLSGLPPDRREREALRLMQAEARRPFDLARGPLLRLTLLRLGAGEHLLLYVLHHIAGDGWSLRLLVEQVAAGYAALATARQPGPRQRQESPAPPVPPIPRGESPGLPAPSIQQADFAHWQRAWLRGEVLERHLGYWRESLQGAPAALRLAAARPRRASHGFRGATHRWALDGVPAAELGRLSRRFDATLFMTLLAAFDVVLHWASGADDLVVGTDVANRNRLENEELMGFFVNQLPLRVRMSGAATFADVVRRAREAALGAYDHQDLPFDKLVDALRPERAAGLHPIFQVKLNFRVGRPLRVDFPGCVITPVEIPGDTAQLDLIVTLVETAGELLGTTEYSTELLSDETVSRLPAQLGLVLRAVLERPETPLPELVAALAAAAERQRLEREQQLEAAAHRRFRERRRQPLAAGTR
jgi:hypothetical protein